MVDEDVSFTNLDAEKPHKKEPFDFSGIENFVPFTERYFTHYLCAKQNILYMQHTNALVCVVTLHKEHPIFKKCSACEGQKVTSVSYNLSSGLDRSSPKLSGKSKKGAQMFSPGDVLCEVYLGEEIIPIVSSISASVIEVSFYVDLINRIFQE